VLNRKEHAGKVEVALDTPALFGLVDQGPCRTIGSGSAEILGGSRGETALRAGVVLSGLLLQSGEQ
jgi:hypothetical protein